VVAQTRVRRRTHIARNRPPSAPARLPRACWLAWRYADLLGLAPVLRGPRRVVPA